MRMLLLLLLVLVTLESAGLVLPLSGLLVGFGMVGLLADPKRLFWYGFVAGVLFDLVNLGRLGGASVGLLVMFGATLWLYKRFELRASTLLVIVGVLVTGLADWTYIGKIVEFRLLMAALMAVALVKIARFDSWDDSGVVLRSR